MRFPYRLFLLTALSVLLAGCKFQALTRIQPDGSGELRTEVGFSAEERKNIEKQNPSGDFCNTGGAPAGTTVTEEPRGDETWCVSVASFDNLDGLRQLYAQRAGVQVNRLDIAEGSLHYDLTIDTSSDSFSGFESITWSVTLPATATSHNASQADGKTLTWMLAPRTGTTHLLAESPAENAGGALASILGILAMIGLVILIGFTLWRLLVPRKKRS
ncbi:MAG TPA: hypothetical protein VGJ22_12365 [Anaerolineales bacterium]|jgi:hypothetical protein